MDHLSASGLGHPHGGVAVYAVLRLYDPETRLQLLICFTALSGMIYGDLDL